jgi:ATP-dependent exoDNAse (exonuclease V) beta subunit
LADIEEIDQRAFVGTFHGFCQSVLENHGHLNIFIFHLFRKISFIDEFTLHISDKI